MKTIQFRYLPLVWSIKADKVESLKLTLFEKKAECGKQFNIEHTNSTGNRD